MFSARLAARQAAASVRARAFSAAAAVRAAPRQSASRAALGLSAIGAGAALLWTVNQQQNKSNTAQCEPTNASSNLLAFTAPPPTMLPVGCYDRTSTRLDGLTPEALATTSLEQLAERYNPDKPDKSSLLHEIVWGAEDSDPFHRHMELLVRTIQDRICTDLIDVERFAADRALGSEGAPATLMQIDGSPINSKLRELLLAQGDKAATFPERIAIRPGIGGGIERVMSGGRVFSKAGINVTVANVTAPKDSFLRLLPDHPSLAGIEPPEKFGLFTASVSLVLHAVSPHVPTCHANYRFFDLSIPATDKAPAKRVQWFGGGSDLTPTYIVEEDARHFHSNLRTRLDAIDPALYPGWKAACDKYFYLSHRGETRGVGGVFFDDETRRSKESYEKIVRSLGESFGAGYYPIVLKRMSQKFDENELAYQQLRRGRYVEFNLVYDKGTTYGLRQPGARVDAILMSLPAVARFAYRRPHADKREEETLKVLQTPKEW